MKLQINAGVFQNMVARAVKGSGSDKNFYITQLMAIELKDNTLTLTTTDGNNYLYVKEEKIAGDDFYAVVPVERFSKLVAKFTCDEITLSIPEAKSGELDRLDIKGNGRYSIELPYDEEGELIEFPDPMSDDDGEVWSDSQVKLSILKKIHSITKSSVMTGDLDSHYRGYYVGDKVVATDTFKVCSVNVPLLENPCLVSPTMMDLIDVMNDEEVEIRTNNEYIVVDSKHTTIFGPVWNGIENYPIDAITSLLDEPYDSSCKVNKTQLIQVLERMALFVDTYDKNSVYLTFTKNGLDVSSKKDKGSELIPYIESTNFKDYTCCADIGLFTSQVKAYPDEAIEIMYGKMPYLIEDEDGASINFGNVKFIGDKVKQIVALADDERVSVEDLD